MPIIIDQTRPPPEDPCPLEHAQLDALQAQYDAGGFITRAEVLAILTMTTP